MKKGLFWALPLVFLLAGCAPSEPARQPGVSPGAETTTPVITEDVPLVTDRYRLEYDSPDRYRLDIALPLLREDLPGAEEINGQIAGDYGAYLEMDPAAFPYQDRGFSYPLVRIHYESFVFEDLLELVVRYESYSLYGSGPVSCNSVYCYDLEEERPVPLSRLMEELEISEEDVVDAYGKAYGLEEAEGEQLLFERDLTGQFFLDGEGTIQIEANQ